MKQNAPRCSLFFETENEKIEAVRELNRLLRANNLPAIHDGLSQSHPAMNIYLCIYETPIEKTFAKEILKEKMRET